MNSFKMVFLFFITLNNSFASNLIKPIRIDVSQITSKASKTKQKNTFCIEVSKNNLYIGEVCRSNNIDFINDFGFKNINSKENKEINIENIKYASGINMYDTKKEFIGGKEFYSTNADCDIYNNSNTYRPTGTCYLSIHRENNGFYLFSTFILKDDVKKNTIISKNEIREILEKTSK